MRRCGDAETRGCGDAGTRGCGDAGMRGCGDAGTRGRGDAEMRGCGDAGMRGRGDAETRGCGDAETRGCGDTGTRRHGDAVMRRRGDAETRRQDPRRVLPRPVFDRSPYTGAGSNQEGRKPGSTLQGGSPETERPGVDGAPAGQRVPGQRRVEVRSNDLRRSLIFLLAEHRFMPS